MPESIISKLKEPILDEQGITIEDQVLHPKGRKLRDCETLGSIHSVGSELVLDVKVISEGDTIKAGSSIDDAPSSRNMLGEDEDITPSLSDGDDEKHVLGSMYEPRSKAGGQQRLGLGEGRQSTFRREESVESEDVGHVVKELMARWTTVVE